MKVMKLLISSSRPDSPSLVCEPSAGGPSTTVHFIPKSSQALRVAVIAFGSQGLRPSIRCTPDTACNTSICLAYGTRGDVGPIINANFIPASRSTALIDCLLIRSPAFDDPKPPIDSAAAKEALFLINFRLLSFIALILSDYLGPSDEATACIIARV